MFERNVQSQSQMPAQQPDESTDSVAGGSRDFSSIPSNVRQTGTGPGAVQIRWITGGRAWRDVCNTREYFFNIRGSRLKPSVLLLRLRRCASEPISAVGLRDQGVRGEFRAHALFWCFVWALFKREGILVFSLTDGPLCLRKQNSTSDWAPCCSQTSPRGPPNGTVELLRLAECLC